MRPNTRVHPTVTALESRELLSSLPVVTNPATIHVEKGSGRGPSGSGGSSIGTLEGTGTLSNFPSHIGSFISLSFMSGTGLVKPFGQVSLDSGSINALIPNGAKVSGGIPLTNASGREVGEIKFTGKDFLKLGFQVLKFPGQNPRLGRVVAHGTGQLSIPQDAFNEPVVTVPFTLTL